MAGRALHSGTPPHNGPASGTPAGGPGQGPASGLPATRRERPPFAPGNLAMLTHGARTPRVYGPLAEELAAGLTEDRPDLAPTQRRWRRGRQPRHKQRCCAATWPRWARSTLTPASPAPSP
jgi:hypothetical protein